MDCWHPIPLRAEKSDAVRRWADLEGKSATMRDDLYQRRSRPGAPQRKFALAGIAIDVAITMLHAIWHFRSG